MTKGFHDTSRQVLLISGSDRIDFLQGLVTNDMAQLDQGCVYAALLTPQGKFMFDFFVVQRDDAILIDVAAAQAAALLQRLTMYRLRADVQIEPDNSAVWRGTGERPAGALADPRHPAMGWRLICDQPPEISALEPGFFEHLRVEHLIPEPELTPDIYILEAGFERINGVDFRKGCYVGQEITARMKHKTELKKGLAKVVISGDPPEFGTPILANGKPVGTLFTVIGDQGIAYLRFDRAKGDMQAGTTTLRRA